jgi:flagellar biosynthesis repressor protein FlbT
MHITLRPQERIYINGAVLRADRKVSLELMNDAVFLLEAHIMHEHQATTPLRQLYYVVQMMLMEPGDQPLNRSMFEQQATALAAVHEDMSLLEGLAKINALVKRKRYFDGLKTIRSLFPVEDAIMNPMPLLASAS